jgi:hypothetical protein
MTFNDLKTNIKSRLNPVRVTSWYGKYERPISSLSLIGGFVFDALTLTRVDQFWENFWIFGHLLIIAPCIIFINSLDNDPGAEANPEKLHFWLVNILQFFFGGLLSVFLVFYFRSADLSVSWPFLLILALVFWANESLKRHFIRLTFQLSLFFLSVFCCFIYLTPVVIHKIGAGTFLISGFASLLFMLLFLHVLVRFSRERFYESRKAIAFSILGIYLTMNLFYFANIIPPIPLSLKDSGVFHDIERKSDGSYVGEYEDYGWRGFLQMYSNYHYMAGDTVYAYSAIFSPSSLNINVTHEWQRYDETSEKWVSEGTVTLPVVGGRDGGFRTYSQRDDLSAGFWRVNVKTSNGLVIGRLRFEVIPVSSEPVLSEKLLQ